MADTSIQVTVEAWIRDQLAAELGNDLEKKTVDLDWGGKFEVDAWSDDGVAVCISTSRYKTANGNSGSGKINKLYKDLLFLLKITKAQKRYFVVTEKDMYEYFVRRREEGRFPPESEVHLLFIDLPHSLRVKLEQSRKAASDELGKNK